MSFGFSIGVYDRFMGALKRVENPDLGVLPARVELPQNDMVALVKKSSVAFYDKSLPEKALFYVPTPSYFGVTMTVLDPFAYEESVAVVVELHNEDTNLNVPLSVLSDVEEGREHWERWAQVLDLPLVVHSLYGEVSGVDDDILAFAIRDMLPECKRPRAMILSSQEEGCERMPGLQYDGWDLVAWP